MSSVQQVYKIGNEIAETREEVLRLACRLMAGRCDGARTTDGMGFNRFDASFGHKMAEVPWKQWSPRQKYAVWEMLARYRHTQLEPWWPLVVPPAKPSELARLDRQREIARHSGKHTGIIRYMKHEGKDYFAVDVPWNSTVSEAINQYCPERTWDKQLKVTLIPYRFDQIEGIFKLSSETGIPVDKPVLDRLLPQLEKVETTLALSHAKESATYQIPEVAGYKPYPFQVAGIQYLVEQANGNGLCADEMGLGKTIQGLLTAKQLGAKKVVVVSPNSAKLNWEEETHRWWPGIDVAVVSGGPGKEALETFRRLRIMDREFRDYPDVIEAARGSNKPYLLDVLNRYHIGYSESSIQKRLFPDRIVVDNGWSPELTQLALERFKLQQTLGKKKSLGVLCGDEWVCVLNWDILHAWAGILIDLGVDIVIADEFHMAKNPTARRSLACEDLMKHAKWRVGLSGTPVMNNPAEFGQLIRLLGYIDVFGGEQAYWKKYVLGIDTALNKTELLAEVNRRARARFMVRRTKKEVLPDMPPLQHAEVRLTMTPVAQARYEEVEADIAAYFAERAAQRAAEVAEDRRMGERLGYRGDDLASYMAEMAKARYDAAYERAETAKALLWWEGLKQICAEGKMPQVFDWIDDFLENSEEKLVVFTSHTNVTEKIAERYNAPMIYGKTPVDMRQDAVLRFQERGIYEGVPGPRVIVGNLQAMGVALTLTKASNVAFVEFGWNPAAHDQASGRCHRIGQLSSVTAWYLTAVRDSGINTVDQDVVELIAKKREIVDAITDGDGAVKDMSILRELSARVAARTIAAKGSKAGPPPSFGKTHLPEGLDIEAASAYATTSQTV